MAQPHNPAPEHLTEKEIVKRAMKLPGMTFRDVLDLGIYPDGVVREYGDKRYKGGMGNLLEERFFGYRANSDQRPDFDDAGIELKTTCIDMLKDGSPTAGERLVLTMISYDEEMPTELTESHLWQKLRKILIVFYMRDKSVDSYDQKIAFTTLFTPPEEDLAVMRQDYRVIADLIRQGRADELSESLTSYLGACTKGSTRASSMRDQSFYAPGKPAVSRAFSLKRSYMEHVLYHHVLGRPEHERIIKDPIDYDRLTLSGYVNALIQSHAGKTDQELCDELELEYTGNKAQWTTITYRLLGIQGERAAEFDKAGIRVRTIRVEPEARRLRESIPVLNIDFMELAAEDEWEDSELRNYLEERSFLFVVFQKTGPEKDDPSVLMGSMMWSMPMSDLDGPVRKCWKRMHDAVVDGPKLVPRRDKNGKVSITNNFPKISDDLIVHVRPRAARAAFRLGPGIEGGNVERDAERLPDGRYITRQAFWFNADYIFGQIKRLLGK